MREIKFRAWDEESKKMIEQPWVTPIGGWHSNLTSFAAVGQKDTLMQFTGLRDKKGKEIYEGDVIKAGEDIGDTLYGQVIWNEKWGCWELDIREFRSFTETDMAKNNWEVIGNIYENPELLTLSKE